MVIQISINDSKSDLFLNILKEFKNDMIEKYQIIKDKQEDKNFISISNKKFVEIWDNKEDEVYDKFL